MSESLSADIRQIVRSYLAGEISFREFQEQFVPATWDIDQTGDIEAMALVYAIELRLAEYTSKHLIKRDLDAYLSQLTAADELSAENQAPYRQASQL